MLFSPRAGTNRLASVEAASILRITPTAIRVVIRPSRRAVTPLEPGGAAARAGQAPADQVEQWSRLRCDHGQPGHPCPAEAAAPHREIEGQTVRIVRGWPMRPRLDWGNCAIINSGVHRVIV